MSITQRIDRITGISPQYRVECPPAPRSVKIELTGRCNYSCSFCARGKLLREQGDMDRELFERLLLEIRRAGVEEIGLFYLGESFMLSWLAEAVEFAKHGAKFPYVFLTTNGSLSKYDRVKRCMVAGLDSLKFSLNYADEAQFVEISKANPRLYKIMLQNIKDARFARDEVLAATGHRCGLYASYIQYDGEQGTRMQKVVDELSPVLDEIYALPLYSQAEYVGQEERERGWSVTAGNRGRIEALRDPLPCWSVFTEGHISYTGKLVACCFSHEGFEMGDLTKEAFMSAWHSAKFQELRRAHLSGNVVGTECERCMAYNT